jgi:hypothetical protein
MDSFRIRPIPAAKFEENHHDNQSKHSRIELADSTKLGDIRARRNPEVHEYRAALGRLAAEHDVTLAGPANARRCPRISLIHVT